MLAPSFDAIELFWRAYFIAVGVAIFMHMHCTANFTTRATVPALCLLPLASGMGMGMVGLVRGVTLIGAYASAL